MNASTPRPRITVLTLLAAALLALALPAIAQQEPAAGAKTDITGWERDGAYNALYDLETFDKIKGYLLEVFEVTPQEDMAPGLAVTMELKEGDAGMGKPDEIVTIHFGPKGHVRFLPYLANPGDKLTVRGSWVHIDGQKVFMASKIKVNEVFEFKVRRTSDGTPYWTMTQEELLREKLVD